VRRALYPRFDERLRWLVDVDSYYRLRLLTRKWRFCEELRISSTVGRKDSITASVKDDLQNLDAQERLYLSQKYSYVSIWLTPKLHSVLITFETFAWALMRAITVFYYYLIYCLSVAINFIFRFRKK
jgi:hypothetical protein